MEFIFSLKSTCYHSYGHPESPTRVIGIYEMLKKKGYSLTEPSPCSDEDILLVHTEELLESVKNGSFFEPDTPNIEGIYEYAKLSVGGAILASQITDKGGIGISIMRPPGHHAGRNKIGGFCYFNNIAIAVKKLRKKTAILDIDCHHGNGTEEIVKGEENILFVSLHRYGMFYPGTGGESFENIINYPLPYYIQEKEYLFYLRDAIARIEEFNPQVLAISLGFDTYKFDPVGGLGIEIETYKEIGKIIREFKGKIFYVLEGGYSPQLPLCFANFLNLK
jgi:acetoin utilization deacetylase AcuC-like enzyme